jgi:SSS family solute:Na+ symporter
MFATIGGFVGSLILKFLPGMVNLAFLAPIGFAKANAEGVYEMPFLDRMGVVFVVVVIGMVIISKLFPNRAANAGQEIEVDPKMFKVDPVFAVGATIICLGLLAVYTIWY